jgi:hypothetical protein
MICFGKKDPANYLPHLAKKKNSLGKMRQITKIFFFFPRRQILTKFSVLFGKILRENFEIPFLGLLGVLNVD